MSGSVVLLGGPDSGKTNYVGRLWQALDAKKGRLIAAQQPENITFVLEVADHLFSGHFAPRSEHTDERRDFEVVVADREGGEETAIVVPDISGELWRNAVQDCEIARGWMQELRQADGALLFVRVGSDQDVRPLDWVTSQRMLAKLGGSEAPGLPTQVMLCELIRFLEVTLANRLDGSRPRLAVVVSAWDLVDAQKVAEGPQVLLGAGVSPTSGPTRRCRPARRACVRAQCGWWRPQGGCRLPGRTLGDRSRWTRVW